MTNLPAPQKNHPLDEPVSIVLGLFTIAATVWVVTKSPLPDLSPWLYVVWIITLAIGVNLGISFESSDANFANLIVTAAFLAVGLAPATLITFVGMSLGEVLRITFPDQFRGRHRTPWRTLVVFFSNLSVYVLSLIAGGALYLALGGEAPSPLLNTDKIANVTFAPLIAPLLGLFMGYLAVNYFLFGVMLQLEGREAALPYFRLHWRSIIVLEIAPMWLAVTVAFNAINISILGFAMFCFFLIVVMVIIHNLSDARARLEKRIQEVASLSAVGQVVANSLDLPTVLEAIYQQTQQLMVARSFYVALYNDQDHRIVFPLAYERGQRSNYPSREFSHGLTEYVIQTAQPLLIKDRTREKLKAQPIITGGLPPNSWLGVPILASDRVMGVIVVQDVEQPNVYTEEHRNILVAIAAQAATAIHNAQMFATAQQHAVELAMLNSISTAISSTLDLDKLLNIIVTSVGKVIGNQKAAIFLIDEDNQQLRLAAAYGLSTDYVAQSQHVPIGPNQRSSAVYTRQPLIITNVETDPRVEDFRPTVMAEGLRAFADMPLQNRGQAIGKLTVYFTETHQFTLAEIDLLTTFANQAAIAVDNAKLYAQTDQALAQRVQQLAALEEIGRDLSSSLDFDRLIHLVLERALTVTGSDFGSISLLDEERQLIKVMATHGYSAEASSALLHTAWPVAQGVAGRAMRTGQVVRIDNVALDPDYIAIDPHVRSELALPIQRNQQIIGAINLESTQVAQFNPAIIDFVSQLTVQAAIALQNAQLYQQAQLRLNEMSVLYSVGRQLTSI